jgi:hypothetical protein
MKILRNRDGKRLREADPTYRENHLFLFTGRSLPQLLDSRRLNSSRLSSRLTCFPICSFYNGPISIKDTD